MMIVFLLYLMSAVVCYCLHRYYYSPEGLFTDKLPEFKRFYFWYTIIVSIVPLLNLYLCILTVYPGTNLWFIIGAFETVYGKKEMK